VRGFVARLGADERRRGAKMMRESVSPTTTLKSDKANRGVERSRTIVGPAEFGYLSAIVRQI
jgi:hypothetical protein